MGDVRNQYTINIVDSGIFRGLGKPPTDGFDKLRSAVNEANQKLVLTQDIYRELGGNPESDPPCSSPYVSPGVDEGWIEVADPLQSIPVVDKAVEAAKQVITSQMNHPKTACADEDATIVGLAAQYFELNEYIDVIIHTTDLALARGANVVISELGYYDFSAEYMSPQEVESRISSPSRFTPPTARHGD